MVFTTCWNDTLAYLMILVNQNNKRLFYSGWEACSVTVKRFLRHFSRFSQKGKAQCAHPCLLINNGINEKNVIGYWYRCLKCNRNSWWISWMVFMRRIYSIEANTMSKLKLWFRYDRLFEKLIIYMYIYISVLFSHELAKPSKRFQWPFNPYSKIMKIYLLSSIPSY